MYIESTSRVFTGAAAGWVTPNFDQVQPAYRPRITANIRTDNTIGLRRRWFALTSESIEGLPGIETGSSTITFVGMGTDTSTGFTAWGCCSGDGTTYSCIIIPSSNLLANTEYTLVVDWTVSGTLTCSVQDTTGTFSVDKTTNLSTANTNLGIEIVTTTLTAAEVNNFTAKVTLEQN